MAAPVEEYLAVLRAAYDYDPQSEDEIAIKESQIVFLLEKTDDDWWRVKIKTNSQDEDAPSGLIPAAYVEPAPHTSTVKALYDYNAAAPGELTIMEDELLLVFDREDEWILVQSQKGGKAGFVPGNYVEEHIAEDAESTASIHHVSSTGLPGRPVSVYVDPADLVAQTSAKVQADDIKTWAVSEVDQKGKKKKGTLGIGNGTFFFASESDKTPVQKWKTADVRDIVIEKQKHVHVDVGGSNPTKLHFAAGNKEVSDTIVRKLESSRDIHSSTRASEETDERPDRITPPPHYAEAVSLSKKNGASVRFTDESPEIIPPREPSEDEDEGAGASGVDQDDENDGEPAVALYEFQGSSPDELSVQEGERLWVIEKEGEEWWKCRNEEGLEGVVPASYLESSGTPSTFMENDAAAREEEARLHMEQQERERLAQEAQKRIDAERKAKERKQAEEEQLAKAALAAEAEKKRREKEEAAAVAEAQRKQRQEAAKRAQQKAEREQSNSPRPASSQSKPSRESTSIRRSSETKSGPPPQSTRTWHDRTGQFRVEAALLGYSNGKLRLHKVNGVVIEVPSEKMSLEDMRYVERLMAKKSAGAGSQSHRRTTDEDDQPLAFKRQGEAAKKLAAQPKRGPSMDWFEFFLSAGCDIDDCTRYATSFEKDKIDETILPDITESTMRSLGLREGDIIRVNKVIQQKYTKTKSPSQNITRDEELARKLQEEEDGKKSTPSPAPNLFASPGGLLKNNTQRRGRPQPSKTLPPSTVDMGAIGSASEQIKRTGSPLVITSSPTTVVSERPSSTTGARAGFDDDAWTNRPGAKSSPTPTPPANAPRPPSAPPASQTVTATPPPSAPPVVLTENQSQESNVGLAKTDADIFDQLARLSQLRTNRTAPSPSPAPTVNPTVTSPPPPPGYNNGLGMGASPVPLGQHFLNQQTGTLPQQHNNPRGPFAPVPANQSLLQPLVPTTTGFSSFVPTRGGSVPPQSFLHSQPTSFSTGNPQHLVPQSTGFPAPGTMITQPTGVSTGSFGTFAVHPSIPNTSTLPVSTNPTGLPPFGQSTFNNLISTPSPTPSVPYPQPQSGSNPSTSPANIFAQMKSGTFATDNDHATPQQANKYDALRVNPQPTGFAPQPTGWGFQPSGYQSGYTGY